MNSVVKVVSVRLTPLIFANLFYYSAYFYYYLWVSLHFLVLFIHESHCTILANFYLYLQYFQQKVFSFSKISGSQTNPKYLKA